MQKEDSKTLLSAMTKIIKHLNKDYGNLLHISVYLRDLQSFIQHSNKTLLEEVFNGLTPLQLAEKLGYMEFLCSTPLYDDPVSGECVIKQEYLKKYLNPLRGYKNRLVKLTVNYILSYSHKITMIPLKDAILKKKDDKIYIITDERRVKFECNGDVDVWYSLLNDKKRREEIANNYKYMKSYNGEPNPYVYMFLCRILLESTKDQNIIDVYRNIDPIGQYFKERGVEVREAESSETFYDSCEEKFYDFESK